MKNSPAATIKSHVLGKLRYVSLAALFSSTVCVTAAYSQSKASSTFAYPAFAYFLDNAGHIFNSDSSVKLLAGTVIGQLNPSQRQTVATAGGLAGYSAAFTVNTGSKSYVTWTDTIDNTQKNGVSLKNIFNDASNLNLTAEQLATKILNAVGIDPTNSSQFPQSVETNVIWAQDIEQNTCNNKDLATSDYGCPLYTDPKTQNSFAQPVGYTRAAAAYIALFWAGRVLLPKMKIIPVPGSYILKVGNNGGTGPSWNLSDVLNGTSGAQNDKYLSLLEPILKIKASLPPTLTLANLQNDNLDLMSFLHLVSYSNTPLIDGFLGQQYSCKPNGNYDSSGELICNALNTAALPGEFSQGDTPMPYDKTLPYALMSAHDNPNQLTYTWSDYPNPLLSTSTGTITPPKTAWTSAYNGCLPFQAGVYWNNADSDLSTFIPTQYLNPTEASSTSLASKNSLHNRRQNYASFKLSVQIEGGSAGVNGAVTSTNTSISCGPQSLLGCNQSVGAYQTVTLVANAAPGRKFLYWTGIDSCKGNSPTCSLMVKADTQVGACFQ